MVGRDKTQNQIIILEYAMLGIELGILYIRVQHYSVPLSGQLQSNFFFFWCTSKKSLPNPLSLKLPSISFRDFSLCFTFKPFICFEQIILYRVKTQLCYFMCEQPIFQSLFVEETILPVRSLNISVSFFKSSNNYFQ